MQSHTLPETKSGLRRILFPPLTELHLSEPCSVGLVWFGLVGLSEAFNASLEPQRRARRRARLAEDAPAHNAFWTGATGRARPNPGTAYAAKRRLITSR